MAPDFRVFREEDEITNDLDPEGYYCYEERDGEFLRLYLLNSEEARAVIAQSQPAPEEPKESSDSAELVDDELLDVAVQMLHQFQSLAGDDHTSTKDIFKKLQGYLRIQECDCCGDPKIKAECHTYKEKVYCKDCARDLFCGDFIIKTLHSKAARSKKDSPVELHLLIRHKKDVHMVPAQEFLRNFNSKQL